MPDAIVLRPDREFLKNILTEGGADVKKCVQCATCSIVCELSTGRKPFPRKEMLWAQWGLKDQLLADPDVWLCHQCNDCSTRCTRGARPGDLLAAVRHQAVKHYATPRFLAEWMGQVKTLPLMILIATALVGFALSIRGPLEEVLPFAVHHEFYADFFPHWLLIGSFTSLTGLAALVVLVGALRFWKAMKASDDSPGGGSAALGIVPSVVNVVKSILTHDKFSKCTSQDRLHDVLWVCSAIRGNDLGRARHLRQPDTRNRFHVSLWPDAPDEDPRERGGGVADLRQCEGDWRSVGEWG